MPVWTPREGCSVCRVSRRSNAERMKGYMQHKDGHSHHFLHGQVEVRFDTVRSRTRFRSGFLQKVPDNATGGKEQPKHDNWPKESIKLQPFPCVMSPITITQWHHRANPPNNDCETIIDKPRANSIVIMP